MCPSKYGLERAPMPETALSVVIPVYRDAEPLGRLLATLRPAPDRQLIVANELTITGSIGVIMQSLNLHGLLDKVGVQPVTYNSGKNKEFCVFSCLLCLTAKIKL